MSSPSDVTGSSPVPLEALAKRASGLSIFLSVLMIVCGFLAILLPLEMSLGVVLVVAWLLMIHGVVQFVHVIRCRAIGDGTWRGAVAVVYFLTGLYLRMNLGLGVLALSLALI